MSGKDEGYDTLYPHIEGLRAEAEIFGGILLVGLGCG